MSGRTTRSRSRAFALLVGTMAFALIAAACGSGTKQATPTTSGTTPTSSSGTLAPISKTLGQGVTATTIKIGFVLIDYTPIEQYIHNTDGDQQQTYQVFVDDINKHGGIDGRKIIPYYYTYVSIGSAGPLAACTSLTEDKKVFATIGVLVDSTGAGQLCFVNQHNSILITHELTQGVIDKANTPGLLLTVSATPESSTAVLLRLLQHNKTLVGKKVGVLGEDATKAGVDSTILPGLKKIGVATGDTATLEISGTDTANAQTQLQSFIEKWKQQGVNAVYLSGDDVVSSQFVQKLHAGLPDALLMTDSEASAQRSASTEPNPNPYEGMLTATNLAAQQNFEQPSFQTCANTYKNALGKPVIAPDDLKPDASGNKIEVYDAMEVACEDLGFLKYVAGKVGPYLNNDNWVQTINNLGVIDNVIPGIHYASMHTGKYDASDDFGLAAFDHTIEDFKLQTPIQNGRGD